MMDAENNGGRVARKTAGSTAGNKSHGGQGKDGRSSPTARESASAFLLWAVFLVPPAAWMIQLFALYMLEDFISCTPGSRTPGVIMGVGVRPLALAITAVLGLLTLGTGVLSWGLWKKPGGAALGGGLPAARWMALAGIMQSVLFTIVIVIKAAPPLILGVCQSPL